MFDLARVGPGCRVLDVAAGAGEQSLAAARRVGASGHVLATDIAPALLERAAADARAAGLAQRRDARARRRGARRACRPASFDAVISRVGLIYFPDQQRALAGMRHALKPGGRVAAIVYSTPERNAFFSIPVKIIRERAQAAAAAARPAGAVLARRRRRARGRLREGRLARHRGAHGAVAGAAAERGRMRALRARVVRRAAPDDGRPERRRTRAGLARHRGRAARVRNRATASSARARCWSASGRCDAGRPASRQSVHRRDM